MTLLKTYLNDFYNFDLDQDGSKTVSFGFKEGYGTHFIKGFLKYFETEECENHIERIIIGFPISKNSTKDFLKIIELSEKFRALKSIYVIELKTKEIEMYIQNLPRFKHLVIQDVEVQPNFCVIKWNKYDRKI